MTARQRAGMAALAALVAATLIFQSFWFPSYAVQPDWEVQTPGGNPFLASQQSIQANSQTCSVSTFKTSTVVLIEGDMTNHVGYTVNDSQHNSWTTASRADSTFGQITDGAFPFSYWVFFATANSNGTDNIVFNGTSVSTSALWCGDIAAINSTGWLYTPTLPIFVSSVFNPFNQSDVGAYHVFGYRNTTVQDYTQGLAILWGTSYQATQDPNIQTLPIPPFQTQCFVGAPSSCSRVSENSGSVSFNFNMGHSIGGEVVGNTWSYATTNCAGLGGSCPAAGWSVLISFPSSNSCLTCQNQAGGSPNTPNNVDLNSLINDMLPMVLFVMLPCFMLGALAAVFGGGVYGFVFGAIIGALVGVLGNQIPTYVLLTVLYGSVALIISNGSGRVGDAEEIDMDVEG